MAMDIKEIMSIIPHRQPFLLIDRVEEIVEGESVTAIKNVTYNEPFFAGHFPNEPVMPGVLIVEAMAQARDLPSRLISSYPIRIQRSCSRVSRRRRHSEASSRE